MEMRQRTNDADQPMPAHAEVRLVVEEHDAGLRSGTDGRGQQRTDDGRMPARLAHHRTSQMIVMTTQLFAALFHRCAHRLRPAVDDDPCRLAFGVRVDDTNLDRVNH